MTPYPKNNEEHKGDDFMNKMFQRGTALLSAAALAAGLAACGSSASSPAAASTTVDDSAIVDVGLVRTGEQACLLRIEAGSFGLVTVAPFTAVAGGLLLTRQNPKDQNSLRR